MNVHACWNKQYYSKQEFFMIMECLPSCGPQGVIHIVYISRQKNICLITVSFSLFFPPFPVIFSFPFSDLNTSCWSRLLFSMVVLVGNSVISAFNFSYTLVFVLGCRWHCLQLSICYIITVCEISDILRLVHILLCIIFIYKCRCGLLSFLFHSNII
jgi:hypothetical protein